MKYIDPREILFVWNNYYIKITQEPHRQIYMVLFLFHPPAMEIFMDIAELFVRHMSVDLRCGNVGVAEEGLDGAEIGAV